ncbi:TlpA family protein disulfide reductase [Pedobacter deserti]|uniref:TlpA family protein disulfide reductase n=1 Tax=Pedobacter deserti TaxID=2817382 RepID=UPI002108CECE|nr:TlpA disulfide reductase family protein [Pedobacter sp. SYSU D00382]
MKSVYIRACLFFILLLFSATTVCAGSPTEVIFTGKIYSKWAAGVTFYSDAAHLAQPNIYSFQAKPDSTFLLRFHLNHPLELTINHIPFFCHPGDSLHIEIYPEGVTPRMKFSGESSEAYNFLVDLYEYEIQKKTANEISSAVTQKNFEQFYHHLKSSLTSKLNSFETFVRDKAPKRDFQDYVFARLYFRYLVSLTSRVFFTEKGNPLLVEKYLNHLTPEKLMNDQHLHSFYYVRSLDILLENLWAKPLLALDDEQILRQQHRFITKHFNDVTKDVMLAYFLSRTFVRKSNQYTNILAKLFERGTMFADHRYNDLLKPSYNQFLATKDDWTSDQTTLISTTGQHISFGELLDSLKGDIIYVDLWASWCEPCKAEFPKSQKLQHRYAGKRVKFIYLSIDKSKHQWKSIHNDLPLDGALSFLIDPPSLDKLKEKINLTTIPRYLLYDKDSKLVSSSAPRPSDDKLTALLDQLTQGDDTNQRGQPIENGRATKN